MTIDEKPATKAEAPGTGKVIRSFYSHHKTASTWGRMIVAEACSALRWTMRPIMAAPHWEGYPTPGAMVRDVQPDMLIVTDPTDERKAELPPTLGFHLIRDPRDIVVSSYFSHMNSHPTKFWNLEWPELVPHREALRTVDHDAGLMKEIDFSGWMIDTMATWDYNQPGMLEVKMEDLTADPLAGWTRIFEHMDMLEPEGDRAFASTARMTWNLSIRLEKPKSVSWVREKLHLPKIRLSRLPRRFLDDTLERHSFSSLAGGRSIGETDVNSHYRRGVAGDWRNHLNDKHLAYFKERFGDLVETLGYEW
jgi:hypothetical protein